MSAVNSTSNGSKKEYRILASQDNKCETLDELIEKCYFNFSISKIKENFDSLDKFVFQSVTTDEVKKEILI